MGRRTGGSSRSRSRLSSPFRKQKRNNSTSISRPKKVNPPAAVTAKPPVLQTAKQPGFFGNLTSFFFADTAARVASHEILHALHPDQEMSESAPIQEQSYSAQDEPSFFDEKPRASRQMSKLCATQMTQFTNCMTRYNNDMNFCQNFYESLKECQNN